MSRIAVTKTKSEVTCARTLPKHERDQRARISSRACQNSFTLGRVLRRTRLQLFGLRSDLFSLSASRSVAMCIVWVRLLFQREQWIISRVHCSPRWEARARRRNQRVHNFHPNGIISRVARVRRSLCSRYPSEERRHAESHGDHLHLRRPPPLAITAAGLRKGKKAKLRAADAFSISFFAEIATLSEFSGNFNFLAAQACSEQLHPHGLKKLGAF